MTVHSCSNANGILKRTTETSMLTEIGAGEGIRTLDPDLGKVSLHGCRHYPSLRYVAISI
jgi:hypothetical protein